MLSHRQQVKDFTSEASWLFAPHEAKAIMLTIGQAH